MTSVDRLGFTLRLKTNEGMKGVRINFLHEVANPEGDPNGACRDGPPGQAIAGKGRLCISLTISFGPLEILIRQGMLRQSRDFLPRR